MKFPKKFAENVVWPTGENAPKVDAYELHSFRESNNAHFADARQQLTERTRILCPVALRMNSANICISLNFFIILAVIDLDPLCLVKSVANDFGYSEQRVRLRFFTEREFNPSEVWFCPILLWWNWGDLSSAIWKESVLSASTFNLLMINIL